MLKKLSAIAISLGLGFSMAFPAIAADRIEFKVGSQELSLSIDELTRYAQTGDPTALGMDWLNFEALPQQQQEQLRKLPKQLNRVIAIEVGDSFEDISARDKQLIEGLKTLIPNTTNEQMFEALKGLASSGNGKTVLSYLEAFPTETISQDNLVPNLIAHNPPERNLFPIQPLPYSPVTPLTSALGTQLFAGNRDISVEILPGSTAGITSFLSLYSPTRIGIGTNRQGGHRVSLGTFTPGMELIFGINAAGNVFLTGPGSRNGDGLAHAQVHYRSPGVADIGFEDLFGGGDRDYDDNLFRFYGLNFAPTIKDLTTVSTIRTNTLFDLSAIAKDLESQNLKYRWDLNGDGIYDDLIRSTGQWWFSDPGQYQLALQVIDEDGVSAFRSVTVEAVPEPSSIFALLSLGLLGVRSRLKRRF